MIKKYSGVVFLLLLFLFALTFTSCNSARTGFNRQKFTKLKQIKCSEEDEVAKFEASEAESVESNQIRNDLDVEPDILPLEDIQLVEDVVQDGLVKIEQIEVENSQKSRIESIEASGPTRHLKQERRRRFQNRNEYNIGRFALILFLVCLVLVTSLAYFVPWLFFIPIPIIFSIIYFAINGKRKTFPRYRRRWLWLLMGFLFIGLIGGAFLFSIIMAWGLGPTILGLIFFGLGMSVALTSISMSVVSFILASKAG